MDLQGDRNGRLESMQTNLKASEASYATTLRTEIYSSEVNDEEEKNIVAPIHVENQAEHQYYHRLQTDSCLWLYEEVGKLSLKGTTTS